MLQFDLSAFIRKLSEKGYATAKVLPRLGGYDITFISPPNIIASKGSSVIRYDLGRRLVQVDNPSAPELLSTFSEIENTFIEMGNELQKCILFYEVQVKAKLTHKKILVKDISLSDTINFDLVTVPVFFTLKDGEPNSTKWFSLKIEPIWTTWNSNKTSFELELVYRDSRANLISFIQNFDKIFNEIIKRIISSFGG